MLMSLLNKCNVINNYNRSVQQLFTKYYHLTSHTGLKTVKATRLLGDFINYTHLGPPLSWCDHMNRLSDWRPGRFAHRLANIRIEDVDENRKINRDKNTSTKF